MASHDETYDAVICGAGIAGAACAYFLTGMLPSSRIAVVDPLPPLSLTSDKSTECYRNWWPGPGDAMVALISRSIDLMEHHARRSDIATAKRKEINVNREIGEPFGYPIHSLEIDKYALLSSFKTEKNNHVD